MYVFYFRKMQLETTSVEQGTHLEEVQNKVRTTNAELERKEFNTTDLTF